MMMKAIDVSLRERARELRRAGKGIAEIGEIIGIPESQAKYLVDDLKLSPEQQRQKSIERKALVFQKRYATKAELVDEAVFKDALKRYGFHGTRQRLKIKGGVVRFLIDKWGIPSNEIAWYPRKSKVIRPTHCGYCGKPYPEDQNRRTKFCSTCYCQVHRLLSKIRAIEYKS